jgi:hypothetical protein
MTQTESNANIATRNDFKEYCETFISKHRMILRSDLNYYVDAVVSTKEGSLIFFEFKDGKGDFKYQQIDAPISLALMRLPQHAFGGDLSNVRFGGTNVIREGNKLIIIKGDNSPNAWSQDEAFKDALKEVRDIVDILAKGRK